jgi:hypothetical protein
MAPFNSTLFKKRHGVPLDEGLSLKEIAKLSGITSRALQEVYNRGIGAYKTNPESVRPQVKSAEQWAFSRLYSFVMKRKGTWGGADKDIVVKYGLE